LEFFIEIILRPWGRLSL